MSKLTDQIRRLLRKKQSRADRMTWSQGDLEKMNDRSKHLAWHPGDLTLIKQKKLSEDLAPAEQHSAMMGHDFKHSVEHEPPAVVGILTSPGEREYRDHVRKLGKGHIEALTKYKRNSKVLNSALRENHSLSDRLKAHHKKMQAITSFRTPKEHIVYRGFNKEMHNAVQNMKKGEVYHDKGYTGTSLDHQMAKLFAVQRRTNTGAHKYMARIHIPKGSKAHYIDSIPNPNDDEAEVLIHHGTKFEVLGHSHYIEGKKTSLPYHVHIVHMRVKEQE